MVRSSIIYQVLWEHAPVVYCGWRSLLMDTTVYLLLATIAIDDNFIGPLLKMMAIYEQLAAQYIAVDNGYRQTPHTIYGGWQWPSMDRILYCDEQYLSIGSFASLSWLKMSIDTHFFASTIAAMLFCWWWRKCSIYQAYGSTATVTVETCCSYLCTHPTVYTWYLPLYGYYFQVPGTPLLFCCLGQRYVPCIILKVYGNSVGIGHLDLRKRQLKMIVRSLEDKSAGTKKNRLERFSRVFRIPLLSRVRHAVPSCGDPEFSRAVLSARRHVRRRVVM